MKKLVLGALALSFAFTACKKETVVESPAGEEVIVTESYSPDVDMTQAEARLREAEAKLAEAKANGDKAAEEAAQKMVTDARAAWESVKAAAENTAEDIETATENAGHKMSNTAQDIKDGAKEAAQDVKNAAKETGSDIKEGYNNALEKAKAK